MTAEENVARVREAYAAYTQGDTGTLLEMVDAQRATPADDRSYQVLTLRDGQIVALRACHSRAEAIAVAGITDVGTGPGKAGRP